MDTRATLYGVAAILMWSTIIALVRSATEAFGVAGGTALIYTVGTVALFLKQGLPKVRRMPAIYLWGCGFLFVAYELLLSQAIGFSTSTRQTLEVGMLNYLWPCCIILMAIWINKQRFNAWLWPGILLALAGIFFCLASGSGIDLPSLARNLSQAPLPYGLAFIGALFWGLYCNVSKRFGGGHNGISLFFLALALILWARFFLGGHELPPVTVWNVIELLFLGVVFGVSYALWETGIQKGNMLLLAILSYFTPVFSMLFASLWLQTMPAPMFWLGVLLVSMGSLLCWKVTINP